MDIEQLKREVIFGTARSSGPGGQHANKTETKVELRFDVSASKALSESEKELIFQKLANRITKEGVLLLSNQSSRFQNTNREAVWELFLKMIRKALTPPRPRRKVRAFVADHETRLRCKRQQAEKKILRKNITFPNEKII